MNTNDSIILNTDEEINQNDLEILSPIIKETETPTWKKTIDNSVSAIVSIKFCTVRPFDTEKAGASVATGFIVDKQKGLILTNRHVVQPGPVVAEAILLDHEEIPIYPIYRDPEHDFGFYKFNPKDVKFMEISEIPLAPEEAKIGVEIRVIGNDAGEKLSILSGTLARLDRPAPNYGDDSYNDCNTFYYQAASSTSGGSSGSPVINISGKAIALNAGGKKKAASSFYLPLHRVLRSLQYIQKDILKIPRGTLQTVFRHCPYDEVTKLGLKPETELRVRNQLPLETGMLVVDQVIPNGPTYKILEPGDILVYINHQLVTTFIEMESILDDNINKSIILSIERGGIPFEFSVIVQDLHSITPSSFLELGGGIFHSLSYQQARNHRLPVGSVYVASEGYIFGRAGLYKGTIIKMIDKTEIPDLNTFINIMTKIPEGEHVPIRYFSVYDRYQEKLSVIYMNRHWHCMAYWTRNDKTGKWDFIDFPIPSLPLEKPKLISAFPLPTDNEIASLVVPSIVTVQYYIPYVIDGGVTDSYIGMGIIIDIEKGLIVVDQNTVPLALGDLLISFGSMIEIPGKVVYLHPIHNFTIIQYNPELLLENFSFKSAILSSDLLHQGDSVYLVGLTKNEQIFCQKTVVSKVEELFINESKPPRFRATNEEVIHLEKSNSCIGAVIVNEKGHILALWCSYSTSEKRNPSSNYEIFRGLPVYLIEDVAIPLKKNEIPQLHSLGVEWWPISLTKVRDLGLSDHWIDYYIEKKNRRRKLLSVRRTLAKTDASDKLKIGDILLAINNQPISTFREMEKLTMHEKIVDLIILHDQKEINLKLETELLSGSGTERIICWSGAILQPVFRAISQIGFLYEGVYCSRWHYGSPAHKYGIRAVHWIIEVNGKPTPNLDIFLNVVKDLPDGSFLRLKICGLQDKISVITLKLDLHYWPTWTLTRDGGEYNGWTFKKIEPPKTS